MVQLSKHNLEPTIEFIFEWRKNYDVTCPELFKKKM